METYEMFAVLLEMEAIKNAIIRVLHHIPYGFGYDYEIKRLCNAMLEIDRAIEVMNERLKKKERRKNERTY